MTVTTKANPTRRGALRTLAAGAAGASLPMWARYTHAQSAAPIRIGFQQHRTGIGAAYGRWYGRATEAAVRGLSTRGAASMDAPSRSSPRMTAPTPSAAPR